MKKGWMLIALGALSCICSFTDSQAVGEQGVLSLGIKSQMHWYNLSKTQIPWVGDVGYDGMNSATLAKLESQQGLLLGPEATFYFGSRRDVVFVRGFYLFGEQELDSTGKVQLNHLSFDVGVLTVMRVFSVGMFFGYRNLRTHFAEVPSPDFSDHNHSIVTWGGLVRTNPQNYGFGMEFDLTMSIYILAYGLYKGVTFSLGPWKTFDEKTMLFDGSLDFSYRFRFIPVTLKAGFSGWYYQQPSEIHRDSYMICWNDTGFGPRASLLYNIDLR